MVVVVVEETEEAIILLLHTTMVTMEAMEVTVEMRDHTTMKVTTTTTAIHPTTMEVMVD